LPRLSGYRSGLKRSVEAGPALKKVDTAIIGGLRVSARF
jgi:hypothetical protein